MRKKQLIATKPAYFRGQLLLEDDFIDEQRYHAGALSRHSLNLHGWGVLRGFEVTRASDSSISISPGVAIDGKGREIAINQAETLELSSFSPSSLLQITLSYQTEPFSKDKPRIDCFGVLAASTGIEEAAIVLATVQLDEHGKLTSKSISTASRRLIRTMLSPDSVTAPTLDISLRKGWFRLAFRPTAIPQDQTGGAPPPFRVGSTQAVSHAIYNKEKNDNGAGGTMAIPLPPGYIQVHQLRVAGQENEKKITVTLFRGGWDPENMKHLGDRKIAASKLVEVEIESGAYDKTYSISKGNLDPVCSTLSIDIRSTGRVSVSLIAVEISY